MSRQINPKRLGSYGIDAPFAPIFMSTMIVILLVLAIVSGRWQTFVPIILPLTVLVLYLYNTLRGKFLIWADLICELHLRGDEQILDLGCGRGAVLLLAAQHLTTGRAVGVDLWLRTDQSGNSMEATRQNAIAEGVADHVDLHTADFTKLPFKDESFDVVVSSLAIHNVRGVGREMAIQEAARVLRSGGRLMIADVRATRQYAAWLAKIGMIDVARRRLGWLPWYLVTATKPSQELP